MLYAVYLGLFLPLAGFFTLLISAKWITRCLTGVIACATILIAFLCFTGLLVVYSNPITFPLYDWLPVPGLETSFAVTLDPLSLVMTLIITGVGFLIHVYSNGYMDHDEDFARFFACLNFFVFSMLLLVLASSSLLMFVGWEGVGLASYLLIGYYYTRPTAASAATKAFVVNRIGDLGFLLALLLTFTLFGTTDIGEVSQRATQEYPVGATVLTVLTLLYFIGAVGKSAQIPLHTWLPDAMEGPTPVSALIHAATMVTAGVYLVVRMHPIFLHTPITLHVVGAIGGVTSLFAALCAVGQSDLKRVLAYSTVSQLGLMFLACGVGAFYAAMFHLTTHAFVKALLFLAAGNVVHMMHGETQMANMGGLSRVFTKTHVLFLIGVLALSGIPPLAAFFSKELILEEEYLAHFYILYGIGLTASILTAFYLTRAYCLTFLGPSPDKKVPVHEAPPIMLIPVALLAFLSIFGGFLGFAFGMTPPLQEFLAQIGITLPEAEIDGKFILTFETLLAVLGGLAGVITAAVLYTRHVDRLGSPLLVLRKAFYLDEIYYALVVGPLKALARFIATGLEPKIFDGFIRGTERTAQALAHGLQQMQSGQIRSYAAWLVIGSGLLIVFLVL